MIEWQRLTCLRCCKDIEPLVEALGDIRPISRNVDQLIIENLCWFNAADKCPYMWREILSFAKD